MKIEVLVDVKTQLGEGPLWDAETERLYWVDSTGMKVFRTTHDGREVRAWDVPQAIGSMALRRNGGAVVSLQRGLHFLDFETGEVAFIVDPEPNKPDNRLNDGKVDRSGRFFVGSLDTTESNKSGALYRLDPDLTLHTLDTEIMCSNGPCWSPDSDVFYFADTWSGEIWVYDYDIASGRISNRRTFVKIESPSGGVADGSTVDAEGCLWNAQVFDGKLVRYAPDGSIDRVVEMPIKMITSVMFGGPHLDILYITSIGKRFKDSFPPDGQLRGSLFAVHGLGVRGLPETRFGG
jgi:L-arabinonolactonase